MIMRWIKKIILVLVILGVGFFGYRAGVYVGEEKILGTPPQIISQDGEIPEKVDFSVFWEAWRKIESDFLKKEKINYQEMVYGAIRGMLETLEDPYTTFFDPQEAEEFEEELSGKYQGVGMMIGIKENQLTVISPLEGSPAQKAGLRARDKILRIDGTYTKDISIEEAVKLIKGAKGTKVKLLIQRKGWPDPKEFEIQREVIKIPTLKWELKEGNIALIEIFQFNKILTSEFKKAAVEILNSKAEKIILDLRNNPGGYLEVVQEIAGWFLEKGQVVVWQDWGEGKKRKAFRSKGPSKFSQYPTLVLINEGSASGAEILAGALRDNRQVPLIGETSFGKGSVQEQVFLSDDSSLKITIANWLTPNGNLIDEEGLEPNIKVELTEEDLKAGRDPQLEKAIELLKSK
ncbi:MAG TPA: S41 family peptidase [Candidatus Atribacteria bacterium]|nr:S41 family peptidase [Candidatus Atribacteria bacterium]